jgi:hypothetical protein
VSERHVIIRPSETGAEPAEESVAFVLCIERGILERQALLLCESIREFGGRYRETAILAVTPRSGYEVSGETRRRLAGLGVEHVDVNLNVECREYGSANRVYASAYAESRLSSEVIVGLDSDTLFLREPDLALGPADVAVRPVDVRGMCTTGWRDPFNGYWRRLARLCGVKYRRIPFLETTIDRVRVRACYNDGLIIARRSAGILGRWAACFSRLVGDQMKPFAGRGLDIHASTGLVGRAASEWWGSCQAALSMAIWGAGAAVRNLGAEYNLPLHLWRDWERAHGRLDLGRTVHVHYHYTLDARFLPDSPLVDPTRGLPLSQLDWLRRRVPLDSVAGESP